MVARFPARIETIEGEITLKELRRTFRHLIPCAQSTVTTSDALNFLCPVVLATLWNIYSQAACPTPPQQPGNIPPYHPTQLQNAMIKEAWAVAKKHFEEYQNMNKTLTECFMPILPTK